VVPWLERAGYIGLTALVVNVVVTVILTAVFRGLKVNNGTDITRDSDYFADIGDPGVQPRVTEEKPIH
jgi:SSS family solute:Na+ symporter